MFGVCNVKESLILMETSSISKIYRWVITACEKTAYEVIWWRKDSKGFYTLSYKISNLKWLTSGFSEEAVNVCAFNMK